MHINSFQNLGHMGYSGHGAQSINIHIKLGKRSDSIHSQHWMLPCSWCYVSVLSFEVGNGNSKVLYIIPLFKDISEVKDKTLHS